MFEVFHQHVFQNVIENVSTFKPLTRSIQVYQEDLEEVT